MKKDLISINDITKDDVISIFNKTVQLKNDKDSQYKPLQDKTHIPKKTNIKILVTP